ncbi:metallophosphoesterase family protein [Halorussus salinisoli]|uniref:metallophosphoesterase family protein n=1 Tax=Halorussus salinisoli TaxID=2558242 RepID=UPI0010C1F021|nr:metallophosphoesterase [Halorussus salinisoli]
MTERPFHRSGQLMARLARPTAEEETTVAVVADPHVSVREEGTMKMFERTESAFRTALTDATDRGVDAVLSVGDLTKDGEPWNYDTVDDAVADLDVPFYAVPGNHDVPKEDDEHDTPPISAFEKRYTPGELPFHAEIGGIDVLGINSSGTEERLTDTHDGVVPSDQLEWLETAVARADAPIVLVHHNLPAMADQLRDYRDAYESEMAIPPVMRETDAFEETLERSGTPLLLTGHLHFPSVAKAGDTWEVMTPTTCSFPQAYLLVTVGPLGTEIRSVPVADREGLSDGHHERWSHSTTTRGLTALGSIRLAEFPLVEEWQPSEKCRNGE